MRSASSSTKWLTSFSFSSPVDIRSQMRPGVPTTMSAPARIRCTCMKRLTPPRIATMRRVIRSPSRCRLASICNASSRVGARMRARVA